MSGRNSSRFHSVVVLSGGVGGAKFCEGLAGSLLADELTIVVNTGDDFEHWGLWICPDLDTVMYTLSGRSNLSQGWGVQNETFATMRIMKEFGAESWFQLGDKDLATHIFRSLQMKRGDSLTSITRSMNKALGVHCSVLPMCNAPRQTKVRTESGQLLDFQQWFVGSRAKPQIAEVIFEGESSPSSEVLKSLANADLILISPSNPYVSIDPILSLSGIRDLLETKLVVAISPIVSGRAIKGPLGEMIPDLTGHPPSAHIVRRHYGALLDAFVVQKGDEYGTEGIPLLATNTIMGDTVDRVRFAREVLSFASEL